MQRKNSVQRNKHKHATKRPKKTKNVIQRMKKSKQRNEQNTPQKNREKKHSMHSLRHRDPWLQTTVVSLPKRAHCAGKSRRIHQVSPRPPAGDDCDILELGIMFFLCAYNVIQANCALENLRVRNPTFFYIKVWVFVGWFHACRYCMCMRIPGLHILYARAERFQKPDSGPPKKTIFLQ